jgi:hypothetical protein
MASSKSSSAKIKAKRIAKLHKRGKLVLGVRVPDGAIPADPTRQTTPDSNSVKCYYTDTEFICRGCGETLTWTAKQQRRYFEVQKGNPYNKATWCTPCHKSRMADLRARHE